jgi:hypothetical protein
MADVYAGGRLPSAECLLRINQVFGCEVSSSDSLVSQELLTGASTSTGGDDASPGALLTVEEKKECEVTRATLHRTSQQWKPQRQPINFIRRNCEAVATAMSTRAQTANIASPSAGPVFM